MRCGTLVLFLQPDLDELYPTARQPLERQLVHACADICHWVCKPICQDPLVMAVQMMLSQAVRLQSSIKGLKIPAGMYANVSGTVLKDPTPQQVLAAGQIVTGTS